MRILIDLSKIMIFAFVIYTSKAFAGTGETPLICAATKNHMHVVECLVELNANLELKDNQGIFLNFATVCMCMYVVVILMCIVM